MGIFYLPHKYGGVAMDNCKVWVHAQQKFLAGFIGVTALYLVLPTHGGLAASYFCELDDAKSHGVTIYPG